MPNHSPSRRSFLRLNGLSKKQNISPTSQSIKSSNSLNQKAMDSIDSILESINSSFELEIEDEIKNIQEVHDDQSHRFIAKINILECMAYNHTICQICQDICPSHISFSSSFYPEIQDSCTGCQKCIAPCPVNAISLDKIQQKG